MPNQPFETLRSGTIVGGRYRIEAPIGSGGFGFVYRATQLALEREVAIKVLGAESAGDSERFIREAKTAQRLEHPNTVRILDVGHLDAGAPFIVFELLRGQTLADWISATGAKPAHVVVHVIAQILKSLMEAHALGIVHRDIKPQNIFVTSHPGEPIFVKVLDFGIAKEIGAAGVDPSASSSRRLTRQSSVLGTPLYMSPEQARGEAVGPPSDLYSVGLVMAELLSGTPVYSPEAAALAIVIAQGSAHPVPLPAWLVSSPLGPVVTRATQKDLRLRYSSAADMIRDVAPLMELGTLSAIDPNAATALPMAAGTTWVARPGDLTPNPSDFASGPTIMVPPPVRRRRIPKWLWAALAGIVLVGVAASAYALWLRDSAAKVKKARDKEAKALREERDREKERADKPLYIEPVVGVDFEARKLVSSDPTVIARRFEEAGYHVEPMANLPPSVTGWAISKAPCGGSVLLYPDFMQSTWDSLGRSPGRKFRRDKDMLYIALASANHMSANGPCSDHASLAVTE